MSYIPFGGVTIEGEVNVAQEEHQFDAYGRMRVSNVTTLFESQLTYNTQSKLWHTVVTGGASASHLPLQSSMELAVGATVGDKVIRQSKVYTRAQLGKSHLVFMTGNLNGGVEGVSKKLGYYDNNNGVYFQSLNGILSLVVRSSATGTVQEIVIPQTSWNVDQLNGTGESEMTIDCNHDQVFCFDIEWMGTGKVRAGLLIDGRMIYVHEFKFANTSNTVYMTTATLPARFEIENITGLNTATMKETAVVIMTEGNSKGFINQFTISNDVAPRQITNSLEPIMSIQPKTIFGNNVNRISSILKTASIFSQDRDIYFEIRVNTVLTNAVWSDVAVDATIEVDLSASDSSGGEVVSSGYISADGIYTDKNVEKFSKYLLTTNYDGSNSTTLTLLAKTLTTPSSDVFATFIWDEEY